MHPPFRSNAARRSPSDLSGIATFLCSSAVVLTRRGPAVERGLANYCRPGHFGFFYPDVFPLFHLLHPGGTRRGSGTEGASWKGAVVCRSGGSHGGGPLAHARRSAARRVWCRERSRTHGGGPLATPRGHPAWLGYGGCWRRAGGVTHYAQLFDRRTVVGEQGEKRPEWLHLAPRTTPPPPGALSPRAPA